MKQDLSNKSLCWNRKRLKCHYVAMTRAKGLLCLAIPSKSVNDEARKELENFGWKLEVI